MIRIQEHLNVNDVENFLTSLAEKHWKELNPKLASGKGYYKISLIEVCKRFALTTEDGWYLDKIALKDTKAAARHKSFFQFLIKNNYTNLKRIIVSPQKEFDKIRNEILQTLLSSDLYVNKQGKHSLTPFGSLLLEEIFNYKKFRSSRFCKEMFVDLGFTSATCPYCNISKLNIIKLRKNSSNQTKLKAYLDLDHFYSKVQNPFFALSFFNLIPTCHDCNAREKGDKPFTLETHIHPYHEAFNDFYKFKISLKTLLGDPVDEIFIERKVNKPLDRTVEDLNLKDRYQNCFQSIKTIIDLFFKNKNKIGTMFEADFIELLLRDIPKDKNDILKYSNAKLNRDILEQLDIEKVLGLN
jgi:hypothetical protein